MTAARTRRGSSGSSPGDRLPRLFIGSSSEGADWAGELQAELRRVCFPIVWSQGVFGRRGLTSTLEELTRSLDNWDFGVLIGTPDDLTTKRSETVASVRDNVLIELGLLTGHLGPERVAIVIPSDVDVTVPSDLAGMTPLDYRFSVTEDEMRASIGPAATTIKHMIRRLGRRTDNTVSPLLTGKAVSHAIDLLGDMSKSYSTGRPEVLGNMDLWVEHILELIYELYTDRAADVAVTWLRPNENDRLAIYKLYGTPYDDPYEYAAGEGLAGRVWSSGISDMHSPEHPSPRWLPRAGCENAVYLCTPVAAAQDGYGVIGVGSNIGFSSSEEDLVRLQLMARTLGLGVQMAGLAR